MLDTVHSCLEEKKDLWEKCGRCCITYPICIEYESEMTLASAYVLYYLSATWLQLQEMEQSLKKMSTDDGMLLYNIRN